MEGRLGRGEGKVPGQVLAMGERTPSPQPPPKSTWCCFPLGCSFSPISLQAPGELHPLSSVLLLVSYLLQRGTQSRGPKVNICASS